jgi:hypothetical protein
MVFPRNSSLGHGDNNDRSHPEQVVLMQHNSNSSAGEDSTIHDNTSFKLRPVMVRDVQMSKLHTGIANFFPIDSDAPLHSSPVSVIVARNCPSDPFVDSCTY